jgi:predicted metal-dependent hydrolase
MERNHVGRLLRSRMRKGRERVQDGGREDAAHMKDGIRRDGVMLCISLKTEWQECNSPKDDGLGLFRVWTPAGTEIAGEPKAPANAYC